MKRIKWELDNACHELFEKAGKYIGKCDLLKILELFCEGEFVRDRMAVLAMSKVLFVEWGCNVEKQCKCDFLVMSSGGTGM